jgi:NADP-dependent 3-hydroxy acid dehydrogenase YdfG
LDVPVGWTVLVTGASRGIGRAIALSLVRRGAHVCLVGRTPESLEVVALACATRSVRPMIFVADLMRDSDVKSTIAMVEGELGRLDVLVHSAGTIVHGPQESLSVEYLDQQYWANVRGPYLLTQGLLPLLKAAAGQIVFINSTMGLETRANVGQFAATQHAFKALADSLRAEVNAAGVRVLSVYPGRTATPRQAELFRAEGRPYDPKLLLQPEDVADIVLAAITLPRTAEVTDIRIRPMIKSY